MAAQPQMQMVPVPPTRPNEWHNRVAVAILAVVVVLAAVPLAWSFIIGPSMCGDGSWDGMLCRDHTGRLLFVGLKIQSEGQNWELIVTSVSGSFPISSLSFEIDDDNGSTVLPAVGLVHLTEANWSTYHVRFVKQGTENTPVPGDKFVIDQATYPSGCRYSLMDGTSILANGTLH